LFERTGKSVKLTDAGFFFLKEARAVLERTDEAVRNVRALVQAGETELHVGYAQALRARLVSPTLRSFQQAMPKVHVKLHDWSYEQISSCLRDGRLQLAFVIHPPKRGEVRDIRFEELLLEQVRLAVSPTHPLAQRRSVSLADAARELFVGLAREDFPEFGAYFSAIFASVKNKPRVIEEHDSISSVISAIEGRHRSRSGCGRAWLQFRQSPETSATYARAKAVLVWNCRTKRTAQSRRGKILAVRQRSSKTIISVRD
jgi:DNA-binding transcriptional LysR family regulator